MFNFTWNEYWIFYTWYLIIYTWSLILFAWYSIFDTWYLIIDRWNELQINWLTLLLNVTWDKHLLENSTHALLFRNSLFWPSLWSAKMYQTGWKMYKTWCLKSQNCPQWTTGRIFYFTQNVNFTVLVTQRKNMLGWILLY